MAINKTSLHAQRIRRQQALRRQQAEARKQAEAQQQKATQAKNQQASAKKLVDQRETRVKPLQLNWQRHVKPAAQGAPKPPLPSLQPGQAMRRALHSETQANAAPAQPELQNDLRNQLRFAQLAAPRTSLSSVSTNSPANATPQAFAPTSQSLGPTPTSSTTGPTGTLVEHNAELEEVNAAQAAFRDEVNDIAPGDSKDQRNAATLEASQALEEQLKQLPPELHDDFFQGVGPELDTLIQHSATLGGDDTDKFIGNLTRASETLGPDNASLLTDKVAEHMAYIDADHGDNKGEFRDGVRDAIADGDGALFGVNLIDSLQSSGEADLANEIAKGTADGIQNVREEFDDKQEDVDKLNAELGRYVAEWSGVLTDEELNAGIEAFKNKHSETYDAWETAGDQLATTFEGAGELVENKHILNGLDERDELLKQVEKGLEKLPAAAQIPSVQELIVEGMEEGSSFITETASFLYDRAGDVNKAKGQADNFAKVIFEVTASRAEELVKSRDLEGLEHLLSDFQNSARSLGVAGVKDPEKLSELTDLVRQARQQTPPDFDAFAEQFTQKSGEISGQAFAADSSAQRAFKSLGLVVGAGALFNDVRNFSDAQIENKLQTLVDAVDLGADAYKFFKNPAAFKTLGKATGGISAALGAIDAVRYGLDGDYANAGLSAAGVVGSILLTTSVGGPVGTAVGAVISVGAVAGSLILDHHRSNQAEDRAEGNLEAFLQGAGLTDDQAYRLRDVTHKSHQSIGRIFSQLGEFNGVEGRQLLDNFLATIPHDAQDEFVDAIERLERNDQGEFTPISLAIAQAIFQEAGLLP